MKLVRLLAVACFALLTAACQGSFSSGTQVPALPAGAGNPTPYGQTSPQSVATGAPNAPQNAPAQSLPLSDAAKGLQCPAVDGFSCVLHFNMPPSTPSPVPSPTPKGKSKKRNATPKPTPSPTATPSPTPAPSPSASGGPSASPRASSSPANNASPGASPAASGATLSLEMTTTPSDAPKMVVTDPKIVQPTVALVRLLLTFSENYALDGPDSLVFTLPKDQLVPNRGFAIQLFEEVTHKKHVDYKPLFTLAKSSLDKQQLTFGFTPPKIELPKDHHYLIVLYGDVLPATPPPSTSPNPNVSASAMPAGPAPTALPSP